MTNKAADIIFRNGLVVTPGGTSKAASRSSTVRSQLSEATGFYRLRVARSISLASIFFLAPSIPNVI